MEKIISYLQDSYHPVSIILYGSYADGTNNKNSDFDALLIISEGSRYHDVSMIEGVQLDVFLYPLSEMHHVQDYGEFIQILDGRIICDTDNVGQLLMDQVKAFGKERPGKSVQACLDELAWCKKMLSRIQREDAEGYFRRHWLLVDSLEIACDILNYPYRGPKKSLRWLKENHSELYAIYFDALRGMRVSSLEKWIDQLERMVT